MQIRNTSLWTLTGGFALMMSAGQAHQAEAAVIYQENFTASADVDTLLNGETPNVGAGAWSASADVAEDGTIGGSGNDNAFLTFSPEAGKIYTLSATLKQSTGGSTTSTWSAIGFFQNNGTTTDIWGNNGGAWIAYRETGDVDGWAGPGTANGIAEDGGTYTGSATISIVLNTQGALWTVQFSADGDPLGSFNYTTNPTINYVGLGRTGSTASDFDSFSLTAVPEPSSLALLGLGGLLAARRRRG